MPVDSSPGEVNNTLVLADRQYICIILVRNLGGMMPVAELNGTYSENWAMDAAWNGDRLKQIRLVAGLSQSALAAAAGVGQGAVSHWEVGVRVPGAEELYRLADALGVSCESFREPEGGKIRWLPGRGPKPAADEE
jgi:DNA-binding XRE family transcriptional regulator